MNPRIRLMTTKDLKPVKRQVYIDMLKDYTAYISNVFDKEKQKAE
jgi:hypothetical protein